MADFLDPLQIHDRTFEQTHALRNMLQGRSTFLIGGGPSSKQYDLSKLRHRGIWTFAVNNAAGHFHANAFVCSDPPKKFHHGIWLDPTVMKFVPTPKFKGYRGELRAKIGDSFQPLLYNGKEQKVIDCPNVWGFGRRAWWSFDDTFFADVQATWGNNNAGVSRTGNPKTLCTMLLAIRLMYYLGSRRIFLVGVDFLMTPESGYSFGQARTPEASASNNAQFAVVNRGLCRMVSNGVFKKFGLEVYNCNALSGLRAFEHIPFDQAVDITLEGFPREPLSMSGWYEKGPVSKEASNESEVCGT